MASTTFVDNQTVIYASWLNDVNSVAYNGTFIASVVTPTNLVCNGTVSGSGFTSLVTNSFASPPAIGSAVPAAGSFTTLSSSGLATLNSLNLSTALSKSYGGTGLTSAGSAGNILTSDGTNWTSASPNGIGVNQTWTNVTGSRTFNATYTNSTGKPILIATTGSSGSGNGSFTQYGIVNGVNIIKTIPYSANSGYQSSLTFIVQNGATYGVNNSGGNSTTVLDTWFELR